MLKIIAWIESKGLIDTSMAIASKMIRENVGKQEECILALFQAMYDSNKTLAEEVSKHRTKKSIVLAP